MMTPMATASQSTSGRRRARGREARRSVSRSDQERWHRPAGATAVQRLRGQEGIRVADLLSLRYQRMAASPWTFFRGAAAVMAADLAAPPHSGLHGADVRRRARPELRPVGHAGAPSRVRPARLRRDPSRTVRVGRQTPRHQPGRRRARERLGRPGRARRRPCRACGATRTGCVATPSSRPAHHLVRRDPRRGAAHPPPRRHARGAAPAASQEGSQARTPGSLRPPRRGGRRSAPHPREPTGPDARRRPAAASRSSTTSSTGTGRPCDRIAACCSTASPTPTSSGRWSGSAASACSSTSCCSPDRAQEPLFLQVKQAGPSVYEEHLGQSRVPQPRRARRQRPAADPERHRHVRRMDQPRRQGLLRPAVPRHEGRPGHSRHQGRACRLRPRVRGSPCQGARPLG